MIKIKGKIRFFHLKIYFSLFFVTFTFIFATRNKQQSTITNRKSFMINFTYLYDKHIDNLFAFGSRFSSDREMIKDCIQDVFVKLYTKKDNLDNVENIDCYLYVSLRNRINDEYRRNLRLCDKEINDTDMKKVAEADAFAHEKQERQQVLSATVERFFDKLSPRQQQIINLYYIEQRKYDDICRIMGINYQSVRNLMHRSIMRLRSLAEAVDVAV